VRNSGCSGLREGGTEGLEVLLLLRAVRATKEPSLEACRFAVLESVFAPDIEEMMAA